MKQYSAEFLGTFWLVLGGCGSAVLAAAFPNVGIGLLGVSLAFGLTVLTMAYAIGHISGCHLNPAVSVGLWAGGRFPAAKLVPYVVAQVLGAVAAGGVLYVIASGAPGFDVAKGFASNGYGAHSPGGYSLLAALVSEVVMTMFFLLVILGATDKRAPAGFAPIAIGLALTLIHLMMHSGNEHVGQPGAKHGCRRLRRRLGCRSALAVLVRSCGWRSLRSRRLSFHRRRGEVKTPNPSIERTCLRHAAHVER
jgi:aquaporin Z